MSKYLGEAGFRHDAPGTTGVLVVNLGTPDAPDRRSVRRYLKQFLWDPRVVEFPRLPWWLILNVIILNVRPSRSAAAYRKIWTSEGSPLLDISTRQVRGIRELLRARHGDGVEVALAMRYGSPSIADGLAELAASAPRRLVVLPMYPQYSASTVGSVFDDVADCLKRWRWVPGLRFINAYHDHPGYVTALAASVEQHWAEHGRGDHLLISFHGVPRRYLLAGDPYHCQCHKTARLLAQALGLQDERWSVCFQSRLGREEWLRPYTDETLERLPGEGVKKLDVICPGFSADCLETLEEVDMQYRSLFASAGGEEFSYVPCLNDAPGHLRFLADLVEEHGGVPVDAATVEERRHRLARARAMGAEQ